MKTPIRILHLEDSPRDAQLIQDRLEMDGLACDIVRVASREQFEAALANDSFDLILCDYNLPDYDGLSALKRAREKHPVTPVLLISGSMGEEEAVKSLHSGATDYLLKQRLERLPSAIKRALEEAQAHREHQGAETALRNSEERFRRAFNTSAVGMAIVGIDGRFLEVNQALCEIIGYSAAELVGKGVAEITHPDDLEFSRGIMKSMLATPDSAVYVEKRYLHKQGHTVWAFLAASLVSDQQSQPLYFVAQIKDITERKLAQQALHESEERFRQLAEHSSEGFWLLVLKPPRILYVNPAVEKIWGLPAERFYQDSDAWAKAIHPDDLPRVRERAEAWHHDRTQSLEAEYRVVRPDGSIRWVLDTGSPIRNEAGEIVRLCGVVRDITERKQTERLMLRSQRLESIGTLAGGVAHDLNNALAPILMGVEILRMQYPDATQLIDTMESSAWRGADMVRQLLTFAKGVEGARLLVQPRHLLKEMEKIIKATFPKNIELRTTHSNNLRTILGDATQLHQVLLNLCVNARDAMPNGGTLTLEAENAEIDATYASAVPEAKPGSYVVWRVNDTGTGIPPEIIERIFEPFFSTKGPDKGTGLGLSTVLGIVKSHGGFVQVYSTPGQGTTFAVYLSAGDSTGGDAPLLTKAEATFRGSGETVLVVDDEAAVREVTRTVLEALNFKVLTAADGTEALMKVAEHRAELRAVITDLHMPHMDGLNFVRVLRHMAPQAGVIVASGRLEEREEKEFKTLGVSALLDKPFTQGKLIEALKTVFQK